MNTLRMIYAVAFLLFPMSANAANGGSVSEFMASEFRIAQSYDAPIYIAGINCSAKARAVAASLYNAQILSVEQSGNTCIIVLKVQGQNGYPPRIVTRTVSG